MPLEIEWKGKYSMVLYVAKRGPHDIGAKVHLQALQDIYGADNVYIVDLISSMPNIQNKYVSFVRSKNVFERLERWIQGNTSYISNRIIREICEIVKENNIDILFSEESDLGYLMKAVKKTKPEIRIICFYHDISADLFAQRKRKSSGMPLYYRYIECNLTIYQEKVSQKYVDENWVFHSGDALKFERTYGYKPQVMIPLASPEPNIPETIKNSTTNNSRKKCLFVCSKYFVNRQGFRWFYDKVLCQIPIEFDLDVVGNGSKALGDFCKDPRIHLIGSVESLDDFYLNSDFVIAPIFDGGGMKVKTMEAVSFAKCIIGTSESLRGFWEKMDENVKGQIVFQCDTADEWINAMNRMLDAPTAKYNPALDNIFKKYFSYNALKGMFKEHLINKASEEIRR